MRIVVMGVSGCGKSTVGQMLAERLDAKFVDGDDLHPEENKAKMAAGIALNDEDRWGWLDKVGSVLAESENVVIACSALKVVYRDRIRAAAEGVKFIHLAGERKILEARLNNRQNHFMPASLLDSQLSTLQPLQKEELGIELDINQNLSDLVSQSLDFLEIS
jgi:carbohydrate kinase (thermoresistant glucokinase family)